MSDDKVEIGKFVLEVAKLVGAAAAGVWAYWRFVKQRTHAPHIEFDLSCRFLGPQDESYVAEYTFSLLNKGFVRQEIRRLKVGVRGIRKLTPLEYREGKNIGLSFPDVIDAVPNLITDKFEYIFVEPGVTQNIRYFSKVDEAFSFIQVRAEFFYRDGNEHTAARVFGVAASDAKTGP